MSAASDGDGPEIKYQGDFIVAVKDGRWEYVRRARGIRAVVIEAIVEEDHLLLVEQYRIPIGRHCLELPAGLIGDDDGGEEDTVEDAAIRELEEETGWRAGRIEEVGEFYSSPGMVSESFTAVRAHDCVKVGEGGGTDSEDITVHKVRLSDMPAFVATKRAQGCAIDVRVMAYLLRS
ncbi:NUDIX hydrolase [Sphingomicrobium astaxanthinifaciens]|uniref:NUDIX hydrolase n=1 Tax=Sphingomicrobium astaxanthinifaciens TaxID=1227949 RepID=UPI001FCAF99C|nr:NUDIX hydrolase [Sphingomicrobium astaxanthinifaciens]MCJ7421893.1 NUDIX hydrolase [Sphingomicrobium astaxanthinifaciens]